MADSDEQSVMDSDEVSSDCSLAIAENFAIMAQALGMEGDLDAMLARICVLATSGLEHCGHAAVSLVEARGHLSTHGATDDVAKEFERLQFRAGEGPSFDAMRLSEVVDVADLLGDRRWPKLRRAATTASGVRSVLSFRLAHREQTLGSLNLYSTEPRAFRSDPAAARWGRVFATHASIGLAGAKTERDLRAALDTRETISVAVGVLMARQRIDRQQAFDILRRASQRMNMKLRDVAVQVAGGDTEQVTDQLVTLDRDAAGL